MGRNRTKNKLLEKYSNLEYFGEDVIWSSRVEKQMDKLPIYIIEKFYDWVCSIKRSGLSRVRMSPGLHDEPLKGDRLGQRSIRLNRAYRVIYVEVEGKFLKIIKVLEVNKHEY